MSVDRFIETHKAFVSSCIKNESQFHFLFDLKKGKFSPSASLQKITLPNFFAL